MIRSYELGVLFLPAHFVSRSRGCLVDDVGIEPNLLQKRAEDRHIRRFRKEHYPVACMRCEKFIEAFKLESL